MIMIDPVGVDSVGDLPFRDHSRWYGHVFWRAC